MKALDKILGFFGLEKKKSPKSTDNFNRFPFLKKAAELNKRMLDEEKKRRELWSEQQLYEDIALLIKKHFEDQNVELKKMVEKLQADLKTEKNKNKGLLAENQILKSQEAVV